MRYIALFLFLISFLPNSAQGPRASRAEIFWALGHPFAASKIKKLTRTAGSAFAMPKVYAELDSFTNGGKADAFRHVYYMAAYSQKIKTKKLRKLGVAHEKTNFRQFKKGLTEYGELPDSLSTVMDLTNNELGLLIGSENRNLPYADLCQKVIAEIKAGKAVIMMRNKNGSFLNCNNEPLNLKIYATKWNVPKCLIASAYTYID